MEGRRIVGVESDGELVLALSRHPVPVVVEMNFGERGMGFGQLIVQFERLQSSGPRLREHHLWVAEQVLGQ